MFWTTQFLVASMKSTLISTQAVGAGFNITSSVNEHAEIVTVNRQPQCT